MICVISCAICGSAALAMKSGSAIGIGWTLPWVMSRRTAALEPRGRPASAPAAAAPPSKSARRRSSQLLCDVELCCVIDIVSRPASLASKAGHVSRVENNRNFLPVLIVLGPEHGVGLPLIQCAYSAVLCGQKERAAAVRHHGRGGRQRAVGLELNRDLHGQLLRILGPNRRVPKLL